MTAWNLPNTSPPPTATSGVMAGSEINLGGWLALTGSLLGAVGAYGAAQAQKDQLKSQASNLEFQSQLSSINARTAEQQAAQQIEAGHRQFGQLSQQYGQARAGARVGAAARGVTQAGSQAELLGSLDLAKEIDRLTIDANSVRAANAARAEAVNYGTQGALQRVSASNMRATAGSISPLMQGTTSLLSSGGQVASQWADFRYRRARSY